MALCINLCQLLLMLSKCLVIIRLATGYAAFMIAFRALTLLLVQQEGNPACKNLEW